MKKLLPIYLSVFFLAFLSCDKEFLEKKSNQKLLVPSTLEDFRLLLDNNGVMNKTPGFGFISSDDFMITDAGFHELSEIERSAYLWQMGSDVDAASTDWNQSYEQVFYSNIVLDGLKKLPNKEVENKLYREVQGAALFYRAYAFFNLLQLYAEPYDPLSAGQTKGIPIKFESDVNIKSKVENLKTCYDLIISDLILAEQLLPRLQKIKTRPSANAALAFLARVSLVTQNFIDGEKYAQKALEEYSELIDYNTLDAGLKNAFPTDYPAGDGNKEVLFYSPFNSYWFLHTLNRQTIINSILYDQYEENDLRKHLFFIDRGMGIINFIGSYSGSKLSSTFSGLTTDELYLTLAECLARNSKTTLAMNYLNKLLENRFVHKEFKPIEVKGSDEALKIILDERRKGLIARGTRWMDLRRLNREGILNPILKRIVLGTEYELNLKESRYFYPFPANEGSN